MTPPPQSSTFQKKEYVSKPCGYSLASYPPLRIPRIRSRLELSHARHTSEPCVCIGDWLHAHAKYSSDALPVKQIAFRAQA